MPDDIPTPDTPPEPTPTYPEPDPRIAELEARVLAAETAASAATVRYREARLAAQPEIPEELVGGASVEEIDASIDRARRIVDAIRSRIAPNVVPAPVVPIASIGRSEGAGSPGAWASLPASERIRAGLAGR